jgi:hypothetical protein
VAHELPEDLEARFASCEDVWFAQPLVGCTALAHLSNDCQLMTMQVMFDVRDANDEGSPWQQIRLVFTEESLALLYRLVADGQLALRLPPASVN